MAFLLANAQAPDSSDSSLLLILLSAGLILGTAVLAFVPVVIARMRFHRNHETLMAVAILWGLLAAGTLVHASIVQMQWSKEQLLRLQSGYLDPQDIGGAPAKPWGTWTALATAYGAIIIWAFASRTSPDPTPPGGPAQNS
ncbi:MAG TPA: hypothetical protein VG269_03575 [Tepidisphaeraceae bacterium]|jgi:hypothetical protein|nr:hypothetical protein [Tepidisphaeraceae bacterium]